MANVVVTGASGFIGAHLVERLLDVGHEVTCLVRSPDRLTAAIRARVRVVCGDVRDPESTRPAVRGADQVFHVAGLVKARRYREMLEVNRAGAYHVGVCCMQQPTPPTLVFVSSLAAAGPCHDLQARRETDPPAPISRYGFSKLAGERALRSLSDRTPLTIVRPSIVFGAGDANSLVMFSTIARFGVHAVPGRQAQPVSVIHVTDLCRLLTLAAHRGQRVSSTRENDDSGQGVYFATAAEQITYADFGAMIGEALGRACVRIVPQPRWAGFALAGVTELAARLRGRSAIINLDKMREAFAGAWHCSGEQAETELGFRTNVPLADRIAETVEWYRVQGWLPRQTRISEFGIRHGRLENRAQVTVSPQNRDAAE